MLGIKTFSVTLLNIRSAAMHKIIHGELHMKKFVFHWVPHDLTKFQKVKHVRICKETLELLNNGGHRLFSKIIIGDELCVPFFHVLKHQESMGL